MVTSQRRAARWVACALAAAACVTGVAMPARAYSKTPVPIASATPTAPEAGSMLAGRACLIVCVSVFCLKGLMHDE